LKSLFSFYKGYINIVRWISKYRKDLPQRVYRIARMSGLNTRERAKTKYKNIIAYVSQLWTF
jgi:hypothetical protein